MSGHVRCLSDANIDARSTASEWNTLWQLMCIVASVGSNTNIFCHGTLVIQIHSGMAVWLNLLHLGPNVGLKSNRTAYIRTFFPDVCPYKHSYHYWPFPPARWSVVCHLCLNQSRYTKKLSWRCHSVDQPVESSLTNLAAWSHLTTVIYWLQWQLWVCQKSVTQCIVWESINI